MSSLPPETKGQTNELLSLQRALPERQPQRSAYLGLCPEIAGGEKSTQLTEERFLLTGKGPSGRWTAAV